MLLLFDIGGTKMRLALSKDGKSIEEVATLDTPADFEQGMSLLKRTAQKIAGSKKIEAIAGGIAGPLDRQKTQLINSPNLAGWVKRPLKKILQKAITKNVYIENDTALVGLGEAVDGAGKEEGVVVYITISTGVGGVRIVDGKIDRNTFGFEPGHQIINSGETLCQGCNFTGHLEGQISGNALERRYQKKPHDITDPQIWEEEAKWLAYGLNNTIVHWSPDIVVLGGSMVMKEPGISIHKVREYLKDILTIFPKHPRLVKAKLGDCGGLHGALVYLKQNIS